ncbi:MAG TPA: sigma-70 family RNA polymerase sigma factor [Bryobacteraceae bacterium]|jgi:RNA polymerase sigma factor (sigma-70 family)|nr:sigma-70 family RNA polymerase sigma factor [Bryobacteraceae bacterium]
MGTAIPAITATPVFVKPPPEVEELYRRYSETVYQSALRVAGNTADAEDVLQVVFLRMLNNRYSTGPSESLDKYFRRAAINASIDVLRRKKWLSEVELDAGREYSAKESTALLKERMRRSLAKLPTEDAEIFVLCYLEGYSYDELAEQFQVERGTIGSRLHRIRAVLKKDLSR